MLNLNDLEIGDSVRFVNGQIAKVVDITRFCKESLDLFFDREVACDIDDSEDVYDSFWQYELNGICSFCQ